MYQQGIPWSTPSIGKEEYRAVTHVMKSNWLSMGDLTTTFERRLWKHFGNKKVTITNNGTSALIAALLAHGVKKDDEVIAPANTFIATINSILAIGAKPVLVDCDINTWNTIPDLVADKITKKTKAIVPVDVAGYPCDYKGFAKLSHNYNIPVVVDSAESMGAYYGKLPSGHRDFKLAFIYSFHIAKQLAMIEGGAIVMPDVSLHNAVKRTRNHGFRAKEEKNYVYDAFGLNLRPTDLLCSIGIEQLKKLKETIRWRKHCVTLYKELLSDRFVYQEKIKCTRPAYLFFGVRTDYRRKYLTALRRHHIGYRICWPFIGKQPYHSVLNIKFNKLHNTKILSNETFTLPLGNATKRKDIEFVCRILKKVKIK